MGFEEEPLVRRTRAMTITMTLMLVLLTWLPKTHIKAAPTSSNAASQDLDDESYDDFEDARTILEKAPGVVLMKPQSHHGIAGLFISI